MKKMIFFLVSFSLLTSCSTTKLKSYGSVSSKPYQKIKTKAEVIHLSIYADTSQSKTIKDNAAFNKADFSASGLIVEQLLKLPDYLGKIIKDRKKKYSQTYGAKNTLNFKTLDKINDSTLKVNLPKLEFTRKIFVESYDQAQSALNLKLTSQILDDKSFAFKISDIDMHFTKAKTNEKYPFVNLNIVIKCSYFEDKDDDKQITEKEYTSESIVIPVKNNIDFTKTYSELDFYSDPFKIEGLKMVEIEVKEVNPYFLKLEEMETNLKDNKDDLSTILTKLTELIKADD